MGRTYRDDDFHIKPKFRGMSLRQILEVDPELRARFEKTEKAYRTAAEDKLRREGDPRPTGEDYDIVINAVADNYRIG